MSSIYEIFRSDAYQMTIFLMEAAGVSNMIPKGASIALKPNLVIDGYGRTRTSFFFFHLICG